MNDRFLRALRCEPVDRTPVWFMRQAGRYLPEYRELRGERDILETLSRPRAGRRDHAPAAATDAEPCRVQSE